MSERASLSLNELVWERVILGDLGGAFELLWGRADANGDECLATRAELQAFCGNEEAALQLASDVQDPGRAASIRAAVAVARGDWEAAHDLAAQSLAAHPAARRTRSLLARAEVELNDLGQALGRFAEIEASSSPLGWDAQLIRARAAADPDSSLAALAARARDEGAARVEAEAFAELGIRREAAGDEPGARAAFVRAVELWDDMLMTLPPPLRSGFWSASLR